VLTRHRFLYKTKRRSIKYVLRIFPSYKTSHAVPTVIPQDPLLFSGTIRSNLDPFGVHGDSTLYGALRAACLVDRADAEEETIVSSDTREITLDTTVEEEGLNLSLGQVRLFVAMRLTLISPRSNPVAMSRRVGSCLGQGLSNRRFG
jgi:hypothetical protein